MATHPIRDVLQRLCTASLHLPVRQKDYRMLKVHLEPADLDLYASRLPPPLGMPEQPRILVEFSEVSPVWHEGILSIACRHGDTTGWHGLYWAIDSHYPCVFGRLVGYPKFMADRMTLTRDDTGRWIGDVLHEGHEHMHVDFSPTPDSAVSTSADSDPEVSSITGPAEERPYFLQVPPETGPSINRLTYTELLTPRTTYRAGRAHVRFDGDPRFSGLLPPEGRSGPAQVLERPGVALGFLYSLRMRRPRYAAAPGAA